jgi:hypothetical protein
MPYLKPSPSAFMLLAVRSHVSGRRTDALTLYESVSISNVISIFKQTSGMAERSFLNHFRPNTVITTSGMAIGDSHTPLLAQTVVFYFSIRPRNVPGYVHKAWHDHRETSLKH